LLAAWRFGALEVVLSDFSLAELVEPQAVVESDLTDRDDLPVLGTLLAALRLGLAQTLVTGDKALLTLRDRYPIRTPAEFWAVHGGL
jgi:predicted nucleic acid-binding protein